MKDIIIEQIPCIRCGNMMPKLRLEKYGYDFCVNCSDVQQKVGRIMTYGTGDHTYNELEIVDPATAQRLDEIERKVTKSTRRTQTSLLDIEEEESFASESVKRSQDSAISKAVENSDGVEDDVYEFES